jgi:AraC-like DNA-binding protein
VFRRNFGITWRAKQTELRLLKARQMLAETGAKIMQVALATGYRHLDSFNAVFTRQFGVTPNQWRKQCALAPPDSLPVNRPVS